MPLENEVKILYKFRDEFLKNIGTKEFYSYEIERIFNKALEDFIDPKPKRTSKTKCGKPGCRGGHIWIEEYKVDTFNCSSH